MFKHSIAAGVAMLTLILGNTGAFANPSSFTQGRSESVMAQAGESPRRERKKKIFLNSLI